MNPVGTQLSAHFGLEEMTRSQVALRLGIPNVPGDDEVTALRSLCAVLLEPVRSLLAVPLHVDSGFRCEALNAYVHGAPDSAHLQGRAADCIPIGMPLREAFDLIHGSALPFDQIIIECDAWLHLSIAAFGNTPRRQALAASVGSAPGSWRYVAVA